MPKRAWVRVRRTTAIAPWASTSWHIADGGGDCLLKLLESFNLHLPHTFVEGFDTIYTCIGNRHSDPTQVDYMATSAPQHFIEHAKIADTCAAISDHWPLSFLLNPKTKAARKPWGQNSSRAKPIGWQLTELSYSDTIREKVGIDIPLI